MLWIVCWPVRPVYVLIRVGSAVLVASYSRESLYHLLPNRVRAGGALQLPLSVFATTTCLWFVFAVDVTHAASYGSVPWDEASVRSTRICSRQQSIRAQKCSVAKTAFGWLLFSTLLRPSFRECRRDLGFALWLKDQLLGIHAAS